MKYILPLLPTLLLAQFSPIDTTRLKATTGAGVASILLDESSVLNPAAAAFFNVGSFYVEKVNSTFESKDPIPEAQTLGIIASDTSGGIKGSLGLFKQKSQGSKRRTLSLGIGRLMGKTSAMGLQGRQVKTTPHGKEAQTHTQFSLGVMHILSPQLSLGIVFQDILRRVREDSRYILGFQYVFHHALSFIGDGGGFLSRDINTGLFYRAAVQINFLSDLFFRVGKTEDHGRFYRGNGLGLSWVGPKLMMDVAILNTQPIYSENQHNPSPYSVQNTKEIAFSLSYRF